MCKFPLYYHIIIIIIDKIARKDIMTANSDKWRIAMSLSLKKGERCRSISLVFNPLLRRINRTILFKHGVITVKHGVCSELFGEKRSQVVSIQQRF